MLSVSAYCLAELRKASLLNIVLLENMHILNYQENNHNSAGLKKEEKTKREKSI